MPHDGYCDKCSQPAKVKRLALAGGAGAFFCRSCWSKEMAIRKTRNKKLAVGYRFHILKWS